MSAYEEYRRQAQYCEAMAHKSNTLEARASWLRLAHKWAALAADKKPPEQNAGTPPSKDSNYKNSSSTD